MNEKASPALLPADTPCGPTSPTSATSAHTEDPRMTQALEDYLATLEAGNCPDREQLRSRYPEIAADLGGYLDGLEFLHQTVVQMRASSCGTAADPGTEAPSAPAPSLEDYEVRREVGRGGMGIVYEAEQRSLQRRVALKVLALGATLDPRHLQRFKNEAQAAAQLQHPNIVPVFAVGCEQGVHYYAMRFIEGKTLSAFIQEVRCGAADTTGAMAATPGNLLSASVSEDPPRVAPLIRDEAFFRQAAWIGVQAAEALEYAHQMGVIHRDVKPANLLLDNEGHLWVADFGLARWSTDAALTMSGDMLGTLRYMSPEQASARRGLVDHRTDIYSLGATLYELLTLQPVSRGVDHHEVLHQILDEDPLPPRRVCRDIPRDLETIVLKALGKQVEERYATAQELADDLRRFLDGRQVLARRPGLWERAGKWARRHRSVVVSAALLLVLSLLGLLAGTILIGREQAKAQDAYEQEAQARQTEADARRSEAEARARAEQNLRQARRLVDYIAEIAAVDMATESNVPKVRRKLLQAALSYYKDFLEQQHDNELTHEELLRGHTRVATLLDAIGRRSDAQAVWNRASRIALTFGDGQGTLHLIPVNSRLRLLRLSSVQEELKLSEQQVRAVLELESRRNERDRHGSHGEPLEQEAVALLSPQQVRRLNQVFLQQRGLWAFEDTAVSKTLALTPAQREALSAIQKEAQTAPRLPGQVEDRGEKSSLERVVRLFTPEQKARWRELVGEPFRAALPPGDLVLCVGGKLVLTMTPVGTGK